MISLPKRAFTIVELIVVIVVVGILAGVAVIGYGSWQRDAADKALRSDMRHAITSLGSFQNFNGAYPPNLAGTGFAASKGQTIVITTNAPSVGTYVNLTENQNLQLFLNSCAAHIGNASPYNRCAINGAPKFQVKGNGPGSATVTWDSPIEAADVALPCGAHCDAAMAAVISDFQAQGGTFPVTVATGEGTALPEPTQTPNGPATKYCMQGTSDNFDDISYFALSETKQISPGTCPDDPELQYYP